MRSPTSPHHTAMRFGRALLPLAEVYPLEQAIDGLHAVVAGQSLACGARSIAPRSSLNRSSIVGRRGSSFVAARRPSAVDHSSIVGPSVGRSSPVVASRRSLRRSLNRSIGPRSSLSVIGKPSVCPSVRRCVGRRSVGASVVVLRPVVAGRRSSDAVGRLSVFDPRPSVVDRSIGRRSWVGRGSVVGVRRSWVVAQASVGPPVDRSSAA